MGEKSFTYELIFGTVRQYLKSSINVIFIPSALCFHS